ncbi:MULTISPECIES: RNA 2',3'-cyclic phosphodiesterase [Geobacillus]|uniref:RNA 2',3'-cyclic phosphodiesterase n=1 Tax=Geobacillus thermocatenulatus TaxID=33938 RepID=A0A226QA00_9BACL|nr:MULTISPECIES: RNA 2',3'-cyclic phosphodiesterase [Geobacillus]ASS98495.1 2'-5' RNA ligase [Geobacillus thermocatenulatus]KLR74110.1 2'-5' RNA ligase [Geobacillus sp. T6]OXB89251.1 2'-5' RNA ligase [Geobacillus thermocatenulatus]RAN22425.1 2'-5' RNA ligase [Geobacillus sp. A8]
MKRNHYFIAVPLTAEVKQAIARFSNEAAPSLPFRTWVHEQDYHITLAFLGDVPLEKMAPLGEAMTAVAARCAPFSLALAGLGTFGERTSPRIFWQGVETEAQLHALRRDVYEACMKLGFSLDRRPFAPHITIARKWQGTEPFHPDRLRSLAAAKAVFSVREMVLYRTNMERTPKYEAIAVFPLLGAPMNGWN